MYVLRALDSAGNRSYYTGRAGDGWVSDNLGDSFKYESLAYARHRGAIFNQMTPLHGLSFVAERICPKCGVLIDMDEEMDAYCSIVG